MIHRLAIWLACAGLLVAVPRLASADPKQEQVDELEKRLEHQDRVIQDLENRLDQIQGEPATPPVGAPAEVEEDTGQAPAPAEAMERKMYPKSQPSPVKDRHNLDDHQDLAPRPGDYVLDPQYRGFIPVPQTVFMVKFNPKPRVDLNWNTRNPGDGPYRFIPARFPVEGDPAHDAGSEFDMSANGSQIRVDLRAPSMDGNFRLYYQNDFFGDDTKQMRYRMQHFYGQYYGFVGGFTYGVFEDPDSWPDTVDYEGPNSLIFARRPLLHYTRTFSDEWNFTLGLEDPSLQIDTTGDPTGNAQKRQRIPDVGFNVRWEPGWGHLQFSSIARSLSTRGGAFGHTNAFGWGVNLSGSAGITDDTTVQWLGVVGEGVGGLGNDAGFDNTDAAFDNPGNLEALPYQSGMLALTHHWTPRWRSTGTFGYVHIKNADLQLGSAYNETYYSSVNVIYQLFKRLSIGTELLWGKREVSNGDDTNDVFRVMVGLVYSPFD
jgi:porin-like protein